jgi:hypothetical protein
VTWVLHATQPLQLPRAARGSVFKSHTHTAGFPGPVTGSWQIIYDYWQATMKYSMQRCNRYTSGLSSASPSRNFKTHILFCRVQFTLLATYIYSPVNSTVRPLCSNTDSGNKCFQTVAYITSWPLFLAAAVKASFLTRILPHVSPTFSQNLWPQSWVPNCNHISKQEIPFRYFWTSRFITINMRERRPLEDTLRH